MHFVWQEAQGQSRGQSKRLSDKQQVTWRRQAASFKRQATSAKLQA